MASRLGLRLAARSLRQPVALTSRTQVGRRAMSSATPQQSSDAPWIAIAGVITVGGLAATFGGGSNKSAHHGSSPASKPKSPPKEEPSKNDETPKGDDGKAPADNSEESANQAEVKESIEKSIKADEPSTAKAEEAKSAGSRKKKDSDSGSESDDDDFVKVSEKDIQDALAQSEKADVPAIAKPAEEKESRSKSESK